VEFPRSSVTPPPSPLPALAQLTPREREILDLLAQGASPTRRSVPSSSSAKQPPKRTSPTSSKNSASATASKPSSTPTKTTSSHPAPDRRSLLGQDSTSGLLATENRRQ